jgi:hypothetical protein
MILSCFFGTCFAFILVIIVIMYLLRARVGESDGEGGLRKLYDVQKPGELQHDEPTCESVQEQTVRDPIELPGSPYETGEVGYL